MLACEGARILAQRGDLDAALIRAATLQLQLTDLGDRKASRFAAGVLAHLLDRAERGPGGRRAAKTLRNRRVVDLWAIGLPGILDRLAR